RQHRRLPRRPRLARRGTRHRALRPAPRPALPHARAAPRRRPRDAAGLRSARRLPRQGRLRGAVPRLRTDGDRAARGARVHALRRPFRDPGGRGRRGIFGPSRRRGRRRALLRDPHRQQAGGPASLAARAAMTGNRTRFMVVSALVTLVMGAASWVAAQSRSQAPAPDSLYKYLSVFTEVLGLVRQAYVKDTDVDTLMAGAYEGAADSLGPFTVYVPPEQVADYRRVHEHPAPDTGLYLLRERGWLYVVGGAAGSAAERAGFQRGELVSKIDRPPTRELQVWQIEQQLGTKKGETVPMSILRQGDAN